MEYITVGPAVANKPYTLYALRSMFEVIVHYPWYMTHCLEVIYPHTKHQKLSLKNKKVTAQTQGCHPKYRNLTFKSK